MLMCWKSPYIVDNISENRREGIERDGQAEKRPLGGTDSSLQPG